jgi:hypothetical protein
VICLVLNKLIVFLLILFCAAFCQPASAMRFNVDTENEKFVYAYDILPSSDFSNFSSALVLAYLVDERSSIELNYLSLNSPILTGQSHTISYRLTFGTDPWGPIWPTWVVGYKFIYTPETDYEYTIDLGFTADMKIWDGLSMSLPISAALFGRDSMVDAACKFNQAAGSLGNITVGYRYLMPVGSSNFPQRAMLVLGFGN